MKSTDEPIVLEYPLNSSAQRVWEALTDLEQMKTWYFHNIETFVPEIGFETQFLVQVEDRKFTHF